MKKKLIICMLSVALLLSCSLSYALAETPQDTIEYSDIEEAIAEIEKSISELDYRAIEEGISEKTGLTLWQIDALIDSGITYDAIGKMTLDEANDILTKDLNKEELEQYYLALEEQLLRAIHPDGYTGVANVPEAGGSDEWFHPNANTTENTISSTVVLARLAANKVFYGNTGTNYSYPNLLYTYYLFGEWGEIPGRENWCHEGLDMVNNLDSTAAAYASGPASGVVVYSSTSGKMVSIYYAGINKTINYQHLNNIDGTGVLREGQTVQPYQYLGNQNTTDKHVHVQVMDGRVEGAISLNYYSGQDLNLQSIIPYSYVFYNSN